MEYALNEYQISTSEGYRLLREVKHDLRCRRRDESHTNSRRFGLLTQADVLGDVHMERVRSPLRVDPLASSGTPRQRPLHRFVSGCVRKTREQVCFEIFRRRSRDRAAPPTSDL
jgi:hypothetical protein